MEQAMARGTPVHLWIVGALATLWNAFGAYDYFMTRTRGAEYIEAMMHTTEGEAIMAYIESFPIWASAAWALGVWGGLAGSILLLMRNRLAVHGFAVSLLGAIVGIGYQLANPAQIAEMREGINALMPYVIIAVAAALLYYAMRQHRNGVLR